MEILIYNTVKNPKNHEKATQTKNLSTSLNFPPSTKNLFINIYLVEILVISVT